MARFWGPWRGWVGPCGGCVTPVGEMGTIFGGAEIPSKVTFGLGKPVWSVAMVPIAIFLETRDPQLHFGGFCSPVGLVDQAAEFFENRPRSAEKAFFGGGAESAGWAEKSKIAVSERMG